MPDVLTEWVPAVSLGVEGAGFALVVLDLYAPDLARRLEDAIHRTADLLGAWRKEGVPGTEDGLGGGLSLAGLATGIWLLLVPIRVALLLAVWFALWPVRLSLEGLDRLAGGHALAGLGLVLAFLGLCLEISELLMS